MLIIPVPALNWNDGGLGFEFGLEIERTRPWGRELGRKYRITAVRTQSRLPARAWTRVHFECVGEMADVLPAHCDGPAIAERHPPGGPGFGAVPGTFDSDCRREDPPHLAGRTALGPAALAAENLHHSGF